MINKFGTKDYGDFNNFEIICKNCGSKRVKISPIHFYNFNKNPSLTNIKLEVRCLDCNTICGASIHSR